ncbi:MAG: hypothetical protein CME71_00830 [Halobacteriovorax sp.]|nr:hypothetical protein [Halobacteriovorax sp.]
MQKTLIFSRHPRFKSWLASIIKRLPIDAAEIKHVDKDADLDAALADSEHLVLLDYGWSEGLELSLSKAKAQVLLLGDIQSMDVGDVWKMRTLCMEQTQIHAFVDFSRDPEFYLPVIRSAILAREGAGKMGEIKALTAKLNALVTQNLSELHRIKKLHERLVPLRGEKIKGLSIHSKFAAGESAGGEFFDTVSMEREVLILMASSNSYVASSAILGHFEELRSKKSCTDEVLEAFIAALSYELKKLQNADVELLLLSLDTNTMEVRGYNFGGATIWRNGSTVNRANELELNPNFVEKARVEFKLGRGEPILLRSSGYAKNLKGTQHESDEKWGDFLKGMEKKSTHEKMGELFYLLKKEQTRDFLKTDASAILIEVDKNAILQV